MLIALSVEWSICNRQFMRIEWMLCSFPRIPVSPPLVIYVSDFIEYGGVAEWRNTTYFSELNNMGEFSHQVNIKQVKTSHDQDTRTSNHRWAVEIFANVCCAEWVGCRSRSRDYSNVKGKSAYKGILQIIAPHQQIKRWFHNWNEISFRSIEEFFVPLNTERV